MPVLKNINSKDLSSINNGLNDLINITRENKYHPQIIEGVISISNLGAYNIVLMPSFYQDRLIYLL